MFNFTENGLSINYYTILLDIVMRKKFKYDGYLTIFVMKLLLFVVMVVINSQLCEVREIFGQSLGNIRQSVTKLYICYHFITLAHQHTYLQTFFEEVIKFFKKEKFSNLNKKFFNCFYNVKTYNLNKIHNHFTFFFLFIFVYI